MGSGAGQVFEMAVDVMTETVIEHPVAEVAAYASDPDHVPDWYANIKRVEWLTEKPLRIGTRLAFVAHFLGRRLEYTYAVTDFVPGQRLVMRTEQGPFPMETTYTWEDMGSGSTRRRLRNRGTPAGFSILVAPFMSMAVRSANRKDLARLKALLERS
jgi:uncharacterized membrane protein